MKLVFPLLAVCLLAAVAQPHEKHQHTASAEAQPPPPPADTLAFHQETIRGEIIDITCYLRHDGRGPGHAQCALECAEMGMPVGVLQRGTGKIYLIVPTDHADPAAPVADYFGKQVQVDAVVYRRGELDSVEILAIEATDQP